MPADADTAGASAFQRVISWGICLLAVVLAVATALWFPPIDTTSRDLPAYLGHWLGLMWGPACSTIGALITTNRPGNRIGWLLVGLGVLVSLVVFASGAGATTHPAAGAFRILSNVGFLPGVSLLAALILLFPDGRPLSPRWRPVVWLAAVWPPLFLLIVIAVAPEKIYAKELGGAPQLVLNALIVVTFIVAISSAYLRFRRSSGIERQQLKWFAYATSIGIAAGMIGPAIPVWGRAISNLGSFGPLVGIAVALFRHRLYDIDVLISRTFVYGALTAILAGIYTASIRLFNVLFVGATGDVSEEWLVITTLILATTFTPIKKRLEEIVERRYKDEPLGEQPTPVADAAGGSTSAGMAVLADPAFMAALETAMERVAHRVMREWDPRNVEQPGSRPPPTGPG